MINVIKNYKVSEHLNFTYKEPDKNGVLRDIIAYVNPVPALEGKWMQFPDKLEDDVFLFVLNLLSMNTSPEGWVEFSNKGVGVYLGLAKEVYESAQFQKELRIAVRVLTNLTMIIKSSYIDNEKTNVVLEASFNYFHECEISTSKEFVHQPEATKFRVRINPNIYEKLNSFLKKHESDFKTEDAININL